MLEAKTGRNLPPLQCPTRYISETFGLALTEHEAYVAGRSLIDVYSRHNRQLVRRIGKIHSDDSRSASSAATATTTTTAATAVTTPAIPTAQDVEFGVIRSIWIHNGQLIVADVLNSVYVLNLDGTLRVTIDTPTAPIGVFVAAGRELCVLHATPKPHLAFYV